MKIQIDDQVRDANNDEVERFELLQNDYDKAQRAQQQQADALQSARAKLAKLGLTDDELEAFLGV